MMTSAILIIEAIDGPAIQWLNDKFPVRTEPTLWQPPNTLTRILVDYSGLIVRSQT